MCVCAITREKIWKIKCEEWRVWNVMNIAAPTAAEKEIQSFNFIVGGPWNWIWIYANCWWSFCCCWWVIFFYPFIYVFFFIFLNLNGVLILFVGAAATTASVLFAVWIIQARWRKIVIMNEWMNEPMNQSKQQQIYVRHKYRSQ